MISRTQGKIHVWHPVKKSRHVISRTIGAIMRKKNVAIETSQERIQMMELVSKDIKIVTATVIYMFKK